MALNYADRNACRVNIVPRCTQIVTELALYKLGLGEANITVGELEWARQALRSAGMYGEQTSHYVMDHPDYIANGSSISDVTLKAVVETAINNHFIIEPSV